MSIRPVRSVATIHSLATTPPSSALNMKQALAWISPAKTIEPTKNSPYKEYMLQSTLYTSMPLVQTLLLCSSLHSYKAVTIM